MFIKDPEKHLSDQAFFSYIKFFDYVVLKKDIDNYDDDGAFSMRDVSLGGEDQAMVFNRILDGAIAVQASVIAKKGYRFDDQMKETKEGLNEKGTDSEKKRISKLIASIERGKAITIQDAAALSWFWFEVYDSIRFTPELCKVSPEVKDNLQSAIEGYLDDFINDKLSISKKNYYRFERQKAILIKLIEEDNKIAKYGNNFIIREKIGRDGSLERAPDFCIVQTVYALQKLGYLKVMNVWEERQYKDNAYDDLVPFVNVNILLDEMFIEEINNSYKKGNPKNVFEKFDEKRGVLFFAGKEITISKKGKETDAILLIKTLLKKEPQTWKYNDEILEDWGYTEDDMERLPKNKVYFAAQKANQAIALVAQIDDFIECNTTKARINPKYIKVDG